MKKIILSLFVIIALLSLTGCGKEVNKTKSIKKNKNEYVCVKKNVDQENSVNHVKYKATYEHSVEIKNKKAKRYRIKTTYVFNTKEECEDSCEVTTDWNNEINEKNYSGFVRKTECSCDRKTYNDITEYNIEKLDKYLRSDIRSLNDDNSFELDSWLEKHKNSDYKCN